MSNIYEALQQAQRDKNEAGYSLDVPLPSENSTKLNEFLKGITSETIPVKNGSGLSMETEMFSLYKNIDFLLPDIQEKIILFIGPQGEEGVSTVVRELAKTAAQRFNKSVLLMDAAHHNPSQHIYFDIKGVYGWHDAMSDGNSLEKACYPTPAANLFLSPISSRFSLPPQVHDYTATAGFFNELKKRFDLILIDSSPAAISPDCLAISRLASGVVLVIEAERTRGYVIESVKNKIERNGGNILGIVFNKRRYYIPDSIYKRLS